MPRNKKLCGIYKITNVINNKIYIGSSIDIYGRIDHHKSCLRRNIHVNSHLQKSWDKYGEENFNFSVVEIVEPDKLESAEQMWIDITGCTDKNMGYNISKHASAPMTGKNHSDESKKKISESQKGKKLTEGHIEKLKQANIGKTMSEETRNKISKGNKGKKRSAEEIEVIRKNSTGRRLSDESKRKISEAKIGKIRSKEELKNMTKYSPEITKKVKELIESGLSVVNISQMLNISESTIYRIKNNKRKIDQ